jgi:hypothetical protein
MKRSEFFKSIFAAATVSIIPSGVKASPEKKYRYDEIFYVSTGNPNLIYPKVDSDIYKEIRKVVEDRLVDNFGYYLPKHDVLLPIKDEYTISDFIPFMLVLENIQYSSFIEYEHESFFRFIKDMRNGVIINDRMHLNLFATHLEETPYAPHVLSNYSD